MREAQVGGHSMEANPWEQLCADLHIEVMELMMCKEKGTAIIMSGDFNIQWGETRGARVWNSLSALAERCGLVNAGVDKFGASLPETFFSGTKKTAIDHFLVSKRLVAEGAVTGMGIWQDEVVNDSDHRVVVLEVDLAPFLRATVGAMRAPPRQRKWIESRLLLSSGEEVLKYQEAVVRRWGENGLALRLSQLQGQVDQWAREGGVWGQDDEAVRDNMDEVMTLALDSLRAAKTEATGPGRWNKNETRSGKKSPASVKARQLCSKIRKLQQAMRWYEQHCDAVPTQRTRSQLKLGSVFYARYRMAHNISLPELHTMEVVTRDNEVHWMRAMGAAALEVASLKRATNGAQKEVWAKARNKYRQVMLDALKKGNWKRISGQVLGKDREEVDRDMLILGEGSARRVVSEPTEVASALDDKFRGWLTREGVNLWFQKWDEEGKQVTWTHPLFLRTEEGWANRKRLIEGLADARTAEFDGWLNEMMREVPEEMRDSLLLFGRKRLGTQGRLIEEDDYVDRGVTKAIDAPGWDGWWVSVGGNKAADSEGTTGNLFKALRKTVTVRGAGGRENRVVLTDSQFHFFRHMLNLVLRTGMPYRSWCKEVVVTLPKVVGSAHLDHVRPIGLINILRNAFMGVQFEGVQRTWDEMQVLSTRQTGGRAGMGTESMRMVKSVAYEYAYVHRLSVGGGN